MKYQVQVTGEAALGLEEQDFEIESENGTEAANDARDKLKKLMPPEGGALQIVVSASEAWEQHSTTPRGGKVVETIPAGIVSEFSVCFEPHESVREAVEAKRAEAQAAADKAAARAEMRREIVAEMAAEAAAAGKVVS
jgi:hypothetical protein